MPDRIRGAWRRFWVLLDSESVRLFIWPFYGGLLAWGLYAAVWARPATLIEPTMGHAFYNFWVWMHIPATLAVLTGLALRHGGTPVAQMNRAMLFRDWLGLWMQFAGHASLTFVLLAYEIAAVNGGHWTQAPYSVFAIGPYVLGAAFLAMQTARKIARGFQLG